MRYFSLSSPGSQSLSCTSPFFNPAAFTSFASASASCEVVAVGFSQ
jgi:hypothetical protein